MEFLSPSQSLYALGLLSDSRTATVDEWHLVQRFIAEQQLVASHGLLVLASLSRETLRHASTFARIAALAQRNGWTCGGLPTLRAELGATNYQGQSR